MLLLTDNVNDVLEFSSNGLLLKSAFKNKVWKSTNEEIQKSCSLIASEYLLLFC